MESYSSETINTNNGGYYFFIMATFCESLCDIDVFFLHLAYFFTSIFRYIKSLKVMNNRVFSFKKL